MRVRTKNPDSTTNEHTISFRYEGWGRNEIGWFHRFCRDGEQVQQIIRDVDDLPDEVSNILSLRPEGQVVVDTTVCTIEATYHEGRKDQFVGRSFCSPDEKCFIHEKGRKLALERAAYVFSRNLRQLLWIAYLERARLVDEGENLVITKNGTKEVLFERSKNAPAGSRRCVDDSLETEKEAL